MKNQKSLALIVATVMLFSFVAVPQANAFIGIVTVGVIIAASFASAVLVNETVIKQNDKATPEQSELKQKTQDDLQAALSEP
jgi:Na+/melibiose symporter-like transporter